MPLGDRGRREQKFKVILHKFLLLKQHAALPSEPERLQRLEFPQWHYLPNTHYCALLGSGLKPLTEISPALCYLYSQPESLRSLESNRRFSSGMRATYPHQSTNDAQPPPQETQPSLSSGPAPLRCSPVEQCSQCLTNSGRRQQRSWYRSYCQASTMLTSQMAPHRQK